MKTLKLTLLTLVAVAASASLASAGTFTFTTTGGSNALGNTGGPVNASATFQTNDVGFLTISLTNNLANPTDVAQNISDLFFTLSNGTSVTSYSSAANFINISSTGVATSAGSGPTGFVLSNVGTSFHLDDLQGTGHAGPAHTIIGPGPYTNANGSIAGNGPHNPFIDQTATFTIQIAGLTSNTSVSNVFFSFGTTEQSLPSVPDSGMTVTLLGSALTGLELLRRRFAKRS